MDVYDNKFFALLRYAIDDKAEKPIVTKEEWHIIYDIAERHALLGVIFIAVSQYDAHNGPDKALLMRWFALSRKIVALNVRQYEHAVKVSAFFKSKGFDCCVLKGQGNAMIYDDVYCRNAGDIDIWVGGGFYKVSKFIKMIYPNANILYIHSDFPDYKGSIVEVHYKPSHLNNLIANFRLQRYFKTIAKEQFDNMVCVPGNIGCMPIPLPSFNRIYQMCHILNHLVVQGIGLRQIVDYYYVLKQGFTEEENKRDRRLLKKFGLYKIASAVMYIEKEMLGLSDRFLIVPPDEKKGKLLLEEILQTGNFGKYDNRVDKSKLGRWGYYKFQIKRNFRLMSIAPGEMLCEPLFRFYHFLWRKFNVK